MYHDVSIVTHENQILMLAFLSTVRIYRHGEFVDYPGPRKADSIIGYMIK